MHAHGTCWLDSGSPLKLDRNDKGCTPGFPLVYASVQEDRATSSCMQYALLMKSKLACVDDALEHMQILLVASLL